MRNLILPILLLLSLLNSGALAQTRLKTVPTAIVEDGFITETAVLVDDNGELFLEVIAGDRVAKTLDNQKYDGEILPPVPISAPARPPRARMREILSFEILTSSNEPVELIDQYSALHAKKRLRLSLASETDQRSLGGQLITVLNDPNIGKPALWHYDANDTEAPWTRLGGLRGDTPEGDIIFSAFLYATGPYTIWDENPNPSFVPAFPLDKIELVEESPYPTTDEARDNTEELPETELNPDLPPDSDVISASKATAMLGLEVSLEAFESAEQTLAEHETETLDPKTVKTVDDINDFYRTSTEFLAGALAYYQNDAELQADIEQAELLRLQLEKVPAIPENQTLINDLNQEITNLIQPHLDMALILDERLEAGKEQSQTLVSSDILGLFGTFSAEEKIEYETQIKSDFNQLYDQHKPILQNDIFTLETTLEIAAATQAELIPALEPPTEDIIVAPTPPVTETPAVNPLSPTLSPKPNLNPNSNVNPLSIFPDEELQANAFQDFGVEEGDLPEAGGFQFPWAIVLLLSVAGFSVYAIRQKPY